MSGTQYYFLPSLRQGLAASIKQPAGATGDVEQRAKLDVVLKVSARTKGASAQPDPEYFPQSVQLYGPGDILGFDPRVIARTYPEPDVGDFEPNYFPAIEFTDEDFVWRYTANVADAKGLAPWITLIVLVAESLGDDVRPEFEEIRSADTNLPPYIKVRLPDSATGTEPYPLPDLTHAWRWVHTQIVDEAGRSDDDILDVARDEPEHAICRVLCPRRLRPKVKYTAFVVPTFKLGVLAGLGYDLDATVGALDPAWQGDDSDEQLPYYTEDDVEGTTVGYLTLPYYFRWEFRTGLRGDFEHLVRLLEPRQLTGLGKRDVDCSNPGFKTHAVERSGLEEPESHYLGLEGVLRSLDTKFTPWGHDADPSTDVTDTHRDIADLVNLNEQVLAAAQPEIEATGAIDQIVVKVQQSSNAAQITWRTAKNAKSRIDYGESDAYGDHVEGDQYRHDHALIIDQLVPGQTYHFSIIAEADDGAIDETGDGVLPMPLLPTVVPPIYGRWHAARNSVNPDDQSAWIDMLNMDPRHRCAAALGSQVIRKQQEALMASAWDQLGAIESVNDLLRRAQFGRETTSTVHGRLESLSADDFLQSTVAVQKRVLIDDETTGQPVTAKHYINTQTRIPRAALDPAFRRIGRRRGPIRKRQELQPGRDLLVKLAAGDLVAATDTLERPLGAMGICDVSKNIRDSLVPRIAFSAAPKFINGEVYAELVWTAENADSCTASGADLWIGEKPSTGSETIGPLGAITNFTLDCDNDFYRVSRSVTVRVTPEVDLMAFSYQVTGASFHSFLKWHSVNSTSCEAQLGWHGAQNAEGFYNDVGPRTEPTLYGLLCNGNGGVAEQTVKGAPACYIGIDENILPDGPLTLHWQSVYATSCSASEDWSGTKGTQGGEVIGPVETTRTYELAAHGGVKDAKSSLTVTVAPTLSLNVSHLHTGKPVRFRWESTNATSCTAYGDWENGSRDLDGTYYIDGGIENTPKTYELTCEGGGGIAYQSVTIKNYMADQVPSIDLKVSTFLTSGHYHALVIWNCTNSISCEADGAWSGAKQLSGIELISLKASRVFTLVCEGPDGDVAGAAVIPNFSPDTSFFVDFDFNVPSTVSENRFILKWDITGVENTSVNASGDWSGDKTEHGTQDVAPITGVHAYVLKATGSGGSTTRSVTINASPALYLAGSAFVVNGATYAKLSWESTHASSCVALGAWSGSRGVTGTQEVGPITAPSVFTLKCEAPGGSATRSVTIDPIAIAEPEPVGGADVGETQFCESDITHDNLVNEMAKDPFTGVAETMPDPGDAAAAAGQVLDGWLNQEDEEEDEPPARDAAFLEGLRNTLLEALKPERTVIERAKQRLHLAGPMAQRFEKGAKGDPLDPVMWAPEFPQPMYEPLRDLSHELLLPGVEKIPQNTLGILKSNRRFLEAYICGLNHEFAGELLWREYPTDQRGSYFRQFWDVSEYVAQEAELQQLLEAWLAELQISAVADLTRDEKTRILKNYIDDRFEEILVRLIARWLMEAGETEESALPVGQREALNRLRVDGLDAIPALADDTLNALTEELMMLVRLEEKLKDITPLVRWRSNPLGENGTRSEEALVLVIRGDLLTRYPGSLIYAIDAATNGEGEEVPALAEYNVTPGTRVFPVFRVTLPPDLTFIGFPFDENAARAKFFVIEERVGEARFGLDTSTDVELGSWDDLAWWHFGLHEQFGAFLDSGTLNNEPATTEGREWTVDTSSATRAWITMQKPPRIAVHGSHMIPEGTN